MITRTFSIDPDTIPPLQEIAHEEDPQCPNVSRVVRRFIAEGLECADNGHGRKRAALPKWQQDAIVLYALRFAVGRAEVEALIGRPLTDDEWERVSAAHATGMQHLDEILTTDGLYRATDPPKGWAAKKRGKRVTT
jgi:hypothetical protein